MQNMPLTEMERISCDLNNAPHSSPDFKLLRFIDFRNDKNKIYQLYLYSNKNGLEIVARSGSEDKPLTVKTYSKESGVANLENKLLQLQVEKIKAGYHIHNDMSYDTN